MWKPAYTLTEGAVSMKLFRNQLDYDTFNERMSSALGVKYIQKYICNETNKFIPENKIEPWNKGLKGQQIPWNKGLTKYTDTRITTKPVKEEMKKQISSKLLGHSVSDKTREKMSLSKKGKIAWNKGKRINSENMRKVKVSNGTKIFNSVKEAAEHENVSSGAIIRRIKRKKNWYYVNIN